ncbi:MAG: hypothetical protein ABSF43_03915 [Rectinemataceae bacterium]|jgi:hypothetical protein
MDNSDPLLKIRFDGEAVGPGKISVAHLLSFLTNMNKAILRTGRVLTGEAQSLSRGTPKRRIKEEVALDLVLLAQGSPAAVLGFERRCAQTALPSMDLGLEIWEKALIGLSFIQKPDDPLPAGYDTGVLMAWRDAGTLFNQGIAKIDFTLNHRDTPLKTTFTPEGFTRIQERIQGPLTNIRTIEGRLLMADFKEHGTRCRVHPSVGDAVLCLFDDDQKEEVLEDILHYVRIVGEAKEDPLTGKIAGIRIRDIERIEDKEDEATYMLPQGTPLSRDFWESPTLDELAQSQNVRPMPDVRTLFGTWPGNLDDDFEMAIDDLRHSRMRGDSLS